MFGYMQEIDPKKDFYIREFGNFSAAMSQQGYDACRRDLIIMRSIRQHFGSDKKMLWIGDFHDITASHAQLVFDSAANYGFMGTNVSRGGGVVPGACVRPISNINWTSFQKSYMEKDKKEEIVVYIHEPTIFMDEVSKRQMTCAEVWSWMKANIEGPIVIRMDNQKWYDGFFPSGPMAYIPYERKLSLRYLVYFNRGSELDWTVGASFDATPYIRGYNFVTRASPVMGQGMDDAIFSLMSKAHAQKNLNTPQDVAAAVNKLCADLRLPVPDVVCRCTSKTLQHGEMWESQIRSGPVCTGLSVAPSRDEALRLAYIEMVGLLDDITVTDKKVSRGCC